MLELRLRLKLFISLSVFWDCHQLVGQYPSPAIAMRKDTNMNMDTNMDVETSMDRETNMNRCLTEWVVLCRLCYSFSFLLYKGYRTSASFQVSIYLVSPLLYRLCERVSWASLGSLVGFLCLPLWSVLPSFYVNKHIVERGTITSKDLAERDYIK